jgi:methionyl-tRNA formyltransferase
MENINFTSCQRLILIGGGSLLARLARWALTEGINVQVITSPRHAEHKISSNYKDFASCLTGEGIPYVVSESISSTEIVEFIGDTTDALPLSLGAAWIFSKDCIQNLFKNRLVNVHGTRLPQYRGGGGFSWQIMNGNRLGFCVLHKIESKLDRGDLLAFEEFIYPPSCRTPKDFKAVYDDKNFDFLTNIFTKAFGDGISFTRIIQPEYFSTYWPRLHTPTDGWVDWSLDAIDIERFICAFDEPYTGAQSLLNGQTVHMKGAIADFNEGSFHPYQAGLVYRNNGRWLQVATKNGSIILQSVTDSEGQSLMNSIVQGDRLFTPLDKLEAAMQVRAIYTPKGIK